MLTMYIEILLGFIAIISQTKISIMSPKSLQFAKLIDGIETLLVDDAD